MNLYWRRFRVADIPLDTPEAFETWLREKWYEKDALMEEYLKTGRFPAMKGAQTDYIETEVRTRHFLEILQVFTIVGASALVWNSIRRAYTAILVLLGR